MTGDASQAAGAAGAQAANAVDGKADGHSLSANVSPKRLGVRVLEPTFSLTPFLSIDAVGSEIWTSLQMYINGDTHQRVPNHSSIILLSVRLLGFVVGLLCE